MFGVKYVFQGTCDYLKDLYFGSRSSQCFSFGLLFDIYISLEFLIFDVLNIDALLRSDVSILI